MNKQRLLFIFIYFLGAGISRAQQQPMFTQYMYNGLLINPAYAGNQLAYEFTGLHRTQFQGFEDAPSTQVLSVNVPIPAKKIGLGLKVMHETLGPAVTMNGLGICYAYQIHMNKSRLALGLEANVMNQSINFPSLRRTNPNDNAIPTNQESVFIPDASAGVYFDRETFFAGFSVTNLFKNKYVYNGINSQNISGNLYRHMNLYTGANFKLSDKFSITPAILGKYVSGAPIQFDFNAIAVYDKKISLGMGFRTDRTMAGIFRVTAKKKISIGYAYDFTTSNLGKYHGGNHEIMLTYKIFLPEPPGKRIVHPRYYF